MFKAMISLIAVLALGVAASTTSASIIGDNFQSYGDTTNFASEANTTYWDLSTNGGAGLAITTEGTNKLLTVDTTTDSAFAQPFVWEPYTTTQGVFAGTGYAGGYAMAFDIRINSSNAIVGHYDIGTYNGATPYVGLTSTGSDPTATTQLFAGSGSSPTLVGNMQVGQWYTVWIVAAGNTPTSNVDFYVDGQLLASGVDSNNIGYLGYNPDLGLVMPFQPYEESISFDNFKFSTTPTDIIPEPASLGLLGLGGLLMLKRRRI